MKPGSDSVVLEHTAAQARARVLMDPRFDAQKRWQALDTDTSATTVADKLASRYASALASSLLRDWSRADASIAVAQGLVAGSPRSDARAIRAVALLKVQSLLMRGDAPGALGTIAPYATDASRPVLLLATQAALAGSDDATLKDRSATLATWVAVNPHDALAWAALGQVSERLGQPLRAIRADAESRVALGDFVGAADRLRAGQRRARSGGAVDFIDASVIDARLRDVEVQRRQIVAEEKGAK